MGFFVDLFVHFTLTESPISQKRNPSQKQSEGLSRVWIQLENSRRRYCLKSSLRRSSSVYRIDYNLKHSVCTHFIFVYKTDFKHSGKCVQTCACQCAEQTTDTLESLSMACENVAYCPNLIRSSAMPIQMVIDWNLAYRKRFLKPNRHLKHGM